LRVEHNAERALFSCRAGRGRVLAVSRRPVV
jgi:hypothetical protein